MVKLTLETLELSYSFVNALKEWELDLRDNKLPAIENLGATLDQYDTIDFTNNDITRLENFPLMNRLKTLLMSNNRIHRIDANIASSLPSLETLILAHNQIVDLVELEGVLKLSKLQYLSLVENPVQRQEYYRQYIIHRLPSLKMLDFKKVTQTEREEVQQVFSGKSGKQLREKIESTRQLISSKTEIPTSKEPEQSIKSKEMAHKESLVSETAKIKEAIKNAKTLDEVARLEKLLRSGRIPETGV